jgi:hypothetical protein
MTKRIVLIILAVILCGTASIAQDKRAEYEKLVDYVNCFYVKSYIETKISTKSDDIGTDYEKDFNKTKKEKLTIDEYNNAKTYNDILLIIGDFPKAKQLAEIIDSKKNDFDENWTNDEIISFLLQLPNDKPTSQGQGFFGFLKNATEKLNKELNNQVSDFFSKEETTKTTVSRNTGKPCKPTGVNISNSSRSIKGELKIGEEIILKAKALPCEENVEFVWKSNHDSIVSVKDGKIKAIGAGTALITVTIKGTDISDKYTVTVKKSSNFWTYIFILIVVGLIGFIFRKRISIFFNKLNSETKNTQKIDYQQKCKQLELENKRLRQDNAQLYTKYKHVEQRINELGQQINKFGQQETHSTDLNEIYVVEKVENSVSQNVNRLYADAIINGAFHRISEQPNEDTVFELLKLPATRRAQFRIYADACKRVIKNPDFVDGCDKQKINAQPQNLKVENGEAMQDDFGKWKVTKKAKIKFI